jgi:outer membrane protein TolC
VVAKREVGGEWGLGPSFAIDVPLWSRGSARDVAAQARLRQELDQFEVLGVEVRSAARTLRDRSIGISDRARYLREVHLPLLNRFLKETLQNFNAMQIGAFEVLDAKEQELDAAREQLDTLREASRARLDLEELLAGSLRPDRLADAPALSSHDARTMKKDH